jgi:hypothetical protein
MVLMAINYQYILNKKIKVIACLLAAFFANNAALAHNVEQLAKLSRTEVASIYFKLGFTHILPFGIDHILFVLSIYLLNPKLKPILWQATAFTVAHTITLCLTMYKVINPPSNMVEPIIALSILYVALENIFSPRLKASRIGIVFLFGLIHGMGFASALVELGLPQNAFFSSLIMFNLGVEFGQIAIIITAFFLLGKIFGSKPYYRKYIVVPTSIIIAIIAAYWVAESVFFA